MLLDAQKQMIEDAYKKDQKLVREIFDVASIMDDEDTVLYIAEHYLQCFDEKEQILLQALLTSNRLRKR